MLLCTCVGVCETTDKAPSKWLLQARWPQAVGEELWDEPQISPSFCLSPGCGKRALLTLLCSPANLFSPDIKPGLEFRKEIAILESVARAPLSGVMFQTSRLIFRESLGGLLLRSPGETPGMEWARPQASFASESVILHPVALIHKDQTFLTGSARVLALRQCKMSVFTGKRKLLLRRQRQARPTRSLLSWLLGTVTHGAEKALPAPERLGGHY